MVRKNISLAQQVVDEIMTGLRDGTLAAADGWLPSETELGQRYNVSRATIREALSKLEQAGVIIRKHGIGTLVAPPAPVIETGLEELESLETLAKRIGLKTHMGEAVIEERAATAEEAERLQLTAGDPVLSVARVMMANDRPVAFLVDVVPITYLQKKDLGKSFNGSVLDLFVKHGEPALSHSRTDIVVEAADGSTARKLHLQRGKTLLKLEAQLFSRDGGVVDYSLSYFVPGYFRFHVVRRVGKSSAL